MNKASIFILTIIVVAMCLNFTLDSCNYKLPEPKYKSDTLLPAITSIGARTFGCKMNGAFWYPTPKVSHSANYKNGGISIECERGGGNNYWGSIFLQSKDGQIFQPGKYYFNKNIKAIYLTTEAMYETPDSYAVGFIEILKLDTINGIISGTFEVSPINTSINPSKVVITQGRFDLKI